MADLKERYFQWLVSTVSNDEHPADSYKKLLRYLHSRSFVYILPMDGNRSEDGIDLRYRGFAYQRGIDYREIAAELDIQDCSVLEMMVSLATRMEDIVSDPDYGDRTSVWFWKMIESIGLRDMTDAWIESNPEGAEAVMEVTVDAFLNREYFPNGKGGLFTLEDCECDLRQMEIWNQMCRFLAHEV